MLPKYFNKSQKLRKHYRLYHPNLYISRHTLSKFDFVSVSINIIDVGLHINYKAPILNENSTSKKHIFRHKK